MRVLLFLAVLAIVGLAVTGAISLQSTPDNKISIQVDKNRVKEDIKEVVDAGKNILHRVEKDRPGSSDTPAEGK